MMEGRWERREARRENDGGGKHRIQKEGERKKGEEGKEKRERMTEEQR